MELAERVCAQNHVRFTKLRRDVLECLSSASHPLKAYDIIEQLRTKGERLTPATVYRTLDFLMAQGLAHRINTLNAYIPCTCDHPDNALLLHVCLGCQNVEEIEDAELYNALRSRFREMGMQLENNSIEMCGLCKECTDLGNTKAGEKEE